MHRYLPVTFLLCTISCNSDCEKKKQDRRSWRAEHITASIERYDSGPVEHRKGQYLYLVQELRARQSGFALARVALPDTWQISSVDVIGEFVVLKTADGRVFKVGKDNNERLFKATNRNKTDKELERIWCDLAQDKTKLPKTKKKQSMATSRPKTGK